MKTLVFLPIFMICLSIHAQSFSIIEYGAICDNQPDTKAIQQAIDDCYANGGGTVIFPSGTWISGTIFLRSNIKIQLEMGAVWKGADNSNAFPFLEPRVLSREDIKPRRAMIYAFQQKNIKICGEGLIYPGGDYDIYKVNNDNAKELYHTRPFGICMIECEDIVLDGIILRNSAFWMQRYLQCTGLRINNLKVFNHANLNNDGLDIDGCNDVVVSNCIIDSSDDALVLKSEGERICENIVISNCILSSHATPLKCGTGSVGGFRNITISNIVIKPSKSKEMHHVLNAWGGLSGIDLLCVDGGLMENVNIDNIIIDGVETPIFIKLGDRNSAWPEKTEFNTGKIRNIRISNITATNSGCITSSITGYEGNFVENISFSNIRMEAVPYHAANNVQLAINKNSVNYPFNRMYGHDYPVYGFYVHYAKNITFNNVEFIGSKFETRSALHFEQTFESRLINSRTKDKKYENRRINTSNPLRLK